MRPKRVALLIETSTSWGSQIIAGIGDYMQRHGRWLLYLDHRGVHEQQSLPSWWEGDGVIARVNSPALAQEVRLQKIACVNVSQFRVPSPWIQQVTTDEVLVGKLAAKTLLATGLQSFAYYGPPKRDFYTDRVLESFAADLTRAGHTLEKLDPDALLRSDHNPHMNLDAVASWVKSLRKPCGILAWNTLGAHRINEACCWANLRVPDDVSILAGDHDQLFAEICQPKLTCIDHAPYRVGYLAAQELARLMAGGTSAEPMYVQPKDVTWHSSVVNSTVDDPIVAEALAFLRSLPLNELSVEKLLNHLPVSRRSLELRFQAVIGRGPAAEIRRIRLHAARHLLAETTLPIKQISTRCGFSTSEQLQRALRAATALTPTRYRVLHRRVPTQWQHDQAPEPAGVS